MMYGFPGVGMYGIGWLMMLFWIVILAVTVYFVIQLVYRATRKTDSQHSDAEQILQERFARGEIDTQAYLEMKQHLNKR